MRKVLVVMAAAVVFACGSDEEDLVLNGFSIAERTVTEANEDRDFSVAVTIDGTVSNASINYRLESESALPGIDYGDVSGNVEFQGGQATINIPIIGDAHLEIMESFDVVLTYEGEEYSYTLNIADDDAIGDIDEDAEGFLTPEEHPSMRLVWADEFDGNSLNTDNWEYELGDGCAISADLCGWGNNELQNYTDLEENIRLEDGRLIIDALDTSEGYTSARIRTKDKYETAFGRIDIRAILPKGQGIWPAFWMLGSNIDEVSWPLCGEIDIMEIVGHEPNILHGTLHYDNGGYQTTSSSTTLSEGDFSDKFHVFTIVWERDLIDWYVDNRLYKSFVASSNHPFNNEFYFLMNTAVGGNWPGNPDATTVFPQQMVIDYIRVFK